MIKRVLWTLITALLLLSGCEPKEDPDVEFVLKDVIKMQPEFQPKNTGFRNVKAVKPLGKLLDVNIPKSYKRTKYDPDQETTYSPDGGNDVHLLFYTKVTDERVEKGKELSATRNFMNRYADRVAQKGRVEIKLPHMEIINGKDWGIVEMKEVENGKQISFERTMLRRFGQQFIMIHIYYSADKGEEFRKMTQTLESSLKSSR